MSDLHPRAPWKDVTFAGGVWSCEERLEKLLTYVRPWFRNIVVAVQESDDRTLEVARDIADLVLEDKWHGRGDPSINLAVTNISTRYAFVVADDEWPSEDLLNSFQDLVTEMRRTGREGAWIKFESWIDGYDFTKGDQHLRFWDKSAAGWPSEPHARPMIDNTLLWGTGFIKHDRTLDEMMLDYVRRYEMGLENPGWSPTVQPHNQRMMHSATRAIAEKRGWDYVKAFEWWPKVREYAWDGEEQFDAAPAEEQEEPTPRRRGRPPKA